MKVRLTETELVSLIKKIMTEQKSLLTEGDGTAEKPFTDVDLTPVVNYLVNVLDLPVFDKDMTDIFDTINPLRNKIALNDDDPNNPVKVSAISRLSQLYTIDETGDILLTDIENISTWKLTNTGVKKKTQTIAVLKAGLAETVPTTPATPPAQGATELKSCASKESGFIDKGDWWIIKPFGQGELRGFSDGRQGKEGNGNLFYVPAGATTHSHVANGSCKSGVLDVGAWSAK